MSSPATAPSARSTSRATCRRTALLTRLLTKEFGDRYSYTEARLLSCLSDGPRRITDLAGSEGPAQPTMTRPGKRLDARGLVRRARQSGDQRVVLVSLTVAGEAALRDLRGLAAAGLRGHLDALSDEQLEALSAATNALADLITALRG